VNLYPDAVEIVEGTTRLMVPSDHSIRGPGTRTGRVFFNGQMAFNRDISVSFFRSLSPNRWDVLDAMGGTGARGVRIAHEAGDDLEVHINDAEEEANSYIERNIILNDVKNAEAHQQDLRCLLTRRVFHYVDVDPFGSPVPFLQSAINGCRRRGMIALTATDTAPLAGTYPKKCLRRYGARPCRSRFGHEVGLRILIGHVAREAAKFDRGIDATLCFYADHYFRVHLHLSEGGGRADKTLDCLGFMDYDPVTGARSLTTTPSGSSYGPMWTGPLFDRTILDGMRSYPELAHPRRVERFLEICKEELDVPLFYESDEIGHILGGSPPPLDSILENLRGSGKASKTHFSPTGFKTDLPHREVLSILGDIL
jgi:tRNA (guanine26-N2/guanine27-N2)-dimethyltransferase